MSSRYPRLHLIRAGCFVFAYKNEHYWCRRYNRRHGIKWIRIMQPIIVNYKFVINWRGFTACCLWLLKKCNILSASTKMCLHSFTICCIVNNRLTAHRTTRKFYCDPPNVSFFLQDNCTSECICWPINIYAFPCRRCNKIS